MKTNLFLINLCIIFLLLNLTNESIIERKLRIKLKKKENHHFKKHKKRKLMGPPVTGMPGVPEFPDVNPKFDVLYQGPLVKLNLGEGIPYGSESKIKDFKKDDKKEGSNEKKDLLKSIFVIDAPVVNF